MLPLERRAIIRDLYWDFRRLLESDGRRITINESVTCRVDPSFNLTSRDSLNFEQEFLYTLPEDLIQGCTVFDIGANQGQFTLLAALSSKSPGRVVSVDASPAAVSVLRRQIELNNLSERVPIVEALVWEQSGVLIKFHAARAASGWASVGSDGRDTHPLWAATTTIDALAKQFGNPRLIKIDIEGAELKALAGARETLQEARPIIYLEIHPAELKELGGTVDELQQLLGQNSYVSSPPISNSTTGGSRFHVRAIPRELNP